MYLEAALTFALSKISTEHQPTRYSQWLYLFSPGNGNMKTFWITINTTILNCQLFLYLTYLFCFRIFFLVSYTTLMLGTLANSKSNRFCSLPDRWFFVIGAIFCLGHGLVTSAYYVSAIAAKKEDKENAQQENPANRSRA